MVEAIRKWAHLLSGRRFEVLTDQQSVSFMYEVPHTTGQKREDNTLAYATQRIRFEIVFRPGELKSLPDALSKAYCASLHESTLYTIHA